MIQRDQAPNIKKGFVSPATPETQHPGLPAGLAGSGPQTQALSKLDSAFRTVNNCVL
jgi:hypothetical protein